MITGKRGAILGKSNCFTRSRRDRDPQQPVDDGAGKQRTVQDIENAAHSGQQVSRVLES